jgi:hypothetical protein
MGQSAGVLPARASASDARPMDAIKILHRIGKIKNIHNTNELMRRKKNDGVQ